MPTITALRTRFQRQSVNPPYGVFWYYPRYFVLSLLAIAAAGGYNAGQIIIKKFCFQSAAQAITQYLKRVFRATTIVEGLWTNASAARILSVLLLIGGSVTVQADPDAVVILPLDEGSGALASDVSGLGNDGTLVDGALFEANTGDGSASSVRFDGVNDHIDLGVVDVAGSSLTLAAWFNADSFPGSARDPRLISKASGTAANDHVFMLSTIRSGVETRLRARVRIGGSTTTLVASSGNFGTGVWRHAAVTYDGVTLRLYLDGVEVGSTPLSGAVDVDATLPVTVGSQPPGAGGRFFDGLLDDVRILQRALSVGEIAAIVDANGVNDAPVAVADTYQTLPDTALVVDAATGVLANDTDPDLDVLQAVLVTDVSNGSLTLNADGSFDYTPNPGFSGSDSFTYQANDAELSSNVATVTILVGAVNSAPQIISGQIVFTKQVVDNAVNEIHFVVAADLNGDDFIDIVATDFVDDSVFWYENDGTGGFVTRVLDANLNGAYPAHVADVDRDGDIDVLAAGYEADTFVWYENDGIGGFTRRDIDTASDGAHSIVTVDMDQDGDVDLLTSSQDAGTIAWYENDGNNNFSRHIIDTTATAAKRADFGDIDGDGDIDVFTASFAVDEIAWLENDGNEGFTKRIIATTANGAYFVSPVDVDGDGDVDVMTASQLDNTFAWYENDGTGGFTEHTIDTSASGARTIVGTDIDGDGDADALGASVNNDTIAWYVNDGTGVFTKQGIDLAADGAYGIFAIDMDSDGDMDVLSGSRDSNEVALHTQIRAHLETVEIGGTLVINDSILLTVDADDGPIDLIYTLTDAPVAGQLQVGGSSVLVGGTFTQDDIDNDRVTYVHDGTNSVTDEFSFTVQDVNGSGAQPVAGTFMISVVGVEDNIVELPLDEGSGTVAIDVSGMSNNGTLVNGASFEATTEDGSASSVRFDGVDDFIDLGSVDVNGIGLTLAAWFNADSYPGAGRDPRIISKAMGIASNDHLFMLGTVASGSETRLRARVRIGGSTTTLIASSGNLDSGVWHHAAVTFDGLTLRLYLDGVEVGSTPRSGVVEVDPSIPVTVGSQPPGAGGRFFDGLIDDVRILQRAMSLGEIAAIVGN